LALVAMIIASAPAYAAGVAFQASSLPLQVRGEGLTETIGAVVLQATGTGTVPAGSSITIVYSGGIASASTAFPGGNTNGLSCSIASLGVATCGAGTTDFSTSATGSQFTVAFNSAVTFAPGDYIEISQVRMNVNALGSATSSVTATLSGTSSAPTTAPITFTQSQVVVASIVNPSVKGSTSGTPVIQTCNVAIGTFSVTATEKYPAAITSGGAPGLDENNFTGTIYTINNGSLINVTVTNVPSGLAVVANTWQVSINGGAASGATAFGSTASGITVSTASTTNQTSTGAALTWTFSVVGDSTGAIESYTFNFSIGLPKSSAPFVQTGTLPAIGTVVSATATVSLSPSSGIVSFATNNEGSGTVATVGDCVTNLLFPFTTNQAGFDSNIQVSNTSADKTAFPSGGATAQAGTCTMTFYPTDLTTQTNSAAGTAGTPSQFTTPTIPAGGAYSFAQSTSAFKGQSGYMFAVCRFLDAHGFSFVVNGTPSTGTISQGLLALVIPNNSIPGTGAAPAGRLSNPANNATFAAGTYEGLAH